MKTLTKTPLALAIATLMMAPYAMADEYTGGFDTDSEIDSEFENEVEVEIEHDAETNKDIKVWGGALILDPNYAGATVDSKQLSEDNFVLNDLVENDARVGGDAGRNASGNIGINSAAGDNNQQANDAALAASDANTVFAQSAAFSVQSSDDNTVVNKGTDNDAGAGGNALRGATGNIGLNSAAGVGNAQQNSLSASVNTSNGSADATSAGVQSNSDNASFNGTGKTKTTKTSQVNGVAAVSGASAGAEAGASAGTYYKHASAGAGAEASAGALAAAYSGSETVTTTKNQMQTNDANLSGNALRDASGNLGVNVAAGNNNQQRNSLSIAAGTGGGSE
ncbi:hypothetical protein [Aidingimonas halophila]|uniref:Adhesin n=1 Tax=Aidingimonas halophila TaxID=574349 RepID=A0A1H2XMT4_9GAMM|nr:hypothetical protein [Aidingimonas halophila]GHC28996.1 hypothetical protein GCM10008094_21290 [Aidingimonas halophila]SDW94135.1 hypothetical protein SAMN05443545_103247 [Aidingimonas halophila]